MTTPSPSSEEMQKDLEYIERHGCTVTEEKMKEVIAYIRSLEKDHKAMRKTLDVMACWKEGDTVTGKLDEPWAARSARDCLNSLLIKP